MVDDAYYAHRRPEVLRLIPEGVRHVVDVGCGAGALGASLKRERPGTEVRGIELVPSQAERARLVLDDAISAPADSPFPEHWPAPDCVIFADVLEHLVDPWATLRLWRQRLRRGAWIVVSLPNVAHASVSVDLLRGRWQYTDEGLLDRTHIRFFTRETALGLIEQASFSVTSAERIVAVPLEVPLRRPLSRWVRAAAARESAGETPGRAARAALELFSYQLLFTARAS